MSLILGSREGCIGTYDQDITVRGTTDIEKRLACIRRKVNDLPRLSPIGRRENRFVMAHDIAYSVVHKARTSEQNVHRNRCLAPMIAAVTTEQDMATFSGRHQSPAGS